MAKKLRVTLSKKFFSLKKNIRLEFDGYSEKPLVICEAWAHIGRPKSAQKHKVMADAIKMLLVQGRAKRFLLFADENAVAHFQSGTWMAYCLKRFGIQIEVIPPPRALKAAIVRAQFRQRR